MNKYLVIFSCLGSEENNHATKGLVVVADKKPSQLEAFQAVYAYLLPDVKKTTLEHYQASSMFCTFTKPFIDSFLEPMGEFDSFHVYECDDLEQSDFGVKYDNFSSKGSIVGEIEMSNVVVYLLSLLEQKAQFMLMLEQMQNAHLKLNAKV